MRIQTAAVLPRPLSNSHGGFNVGLVILLSWLAIVECRRLSNMVGFSLSKEREFSGRP